MAGAPRPVWELGAELGEGPVWVERDRALWFTDIKRPAIYRFDPETAEKRSWDAPRHVGFVLPTERGDFIAGLKDGLYRFDPNSGRFDELAAIDAHLRANRLNDGVVDPAGRLWFGTMDNEERDQSGAFYRYERGQLHETGLTGICITNGPAVSPDGRTLYWVDTFARAIFASGIADDGSLGEPREFVTIGEGEGYPDGPTVDSEGCVWISLYAGWETRRYSPAGELLERVRFPVANITKIAFGGPGLRTAYATTARQGLKAEELEAQPLAGALFEFQVDVPGIASALVVD